MVSKNDRCEIKVVFGNDLNIWTHVWRDEVLKKLFNIHLEGNLKLVVEE